MDLWVRETILDKLLHQYKMLVVKAREKSKPAPLMLKSFKVKHSLRVQLNLRQRQRLLAMLTSISCKQTSKTRQQSLALCAQTKQETFRIIDLSMLRKIQASIALALCQMLHCRKIKITMDLWQEQLIFQTQTNLLKTR